MITGSPARTLIAFAVPMIVGHLFQQCYSLADTIIVGQFLGDSAVSAVGSTASIIMVFVAIANGFAVGASIIISQLFGSRDYTKMKTAFNTAFVSFVGLSVLALAIGFSTCSAFLTITKIPQQIVGDAKAYYYIYAAGFPGLFFYNVANSGFNALGKSKMPFIFLAISSFMNIGLDLLFVVVFHWGVAGAALATTISQYFAAVIAFVSLLRYLKKNFKTEEKPKMFDGFMLKTIAKVAVPSMVTSSVISVGFVVMQSLINSFGKDVMTAYATGMKIDGIAIVPLVQIGNAVSTFAAQNVGAGQNDRVPKGYRVSIVMNAAICAFIGIMLYFFGGSLIGVFLDPEKCTNFANIISIGSEYLRVVGCFYFILGMLYITTGLLRGVGEAFWAMVATLVNFGCRVAFAYIMVAIVNKVGIIWWSNLVGWCCGTLVALICYLSGRWKKKNLLKGLG